MPTEISNDAASAARALHRAIEDNYDSLKQQCTSEAETAACDAFWEIQAKTFASDNLEVQTLTDQLNAANQKISDSLAGLKDIVQFLNFATEAVGLAASLAKLAAA